MKGILYLGGGELEKHLGLHFLSFGIGGFRGLDPSIFRLNLLRQILCLLQRIRCALNDLSHLHSYRSRQQV